jgi:hypothetical protein
MISKMSVIIATDTTIIGLRWPIDKRLALIKILTL